MPESMTSLRPTALPIRRTRPARKRLKPPSVTTTGITGWMQRQSIRWCSSSAMTARFMSLPSPSVKRTGTDAILPTTGLGPTPCPSPPILTHGVLTATAIWPSAAIPVWSICFSARPAKPTLYLALSWYFLGVFVSCAAPLPVARSRSRRDRLCNGGSVIVIFL